MTDQQELATLHRKPVEPLGPTGDTVALCLSTATDDQLYGAAVLIQTEMMRRLYRVAFGDKLSAPQVG